MKHLVVGYRGKVGAALYELLAETNNEVEGIEKEETAILYQFDFIHFCIPSDSKWEEILEEYVCFNDAIIIIHSTMDPSLIEDLGADSLTIVELVMSMEEIFEIEIDDEDAEKLLTVQDAIDFIKSKS